MTASYFISLMITVWKTKSPLKCSSHLLTLMLMSTYTLPTSQSGTMTVSSFSLTLANTFTIGVSFQMFGLVFRITHTLLLRMTGQSQSALNW